MWKLLTVVTVSAMLAWPCTVTAAPPAGTVSHSTVQNALARARTGPLAAAAAREVAQLAAASAARDARGVEAARVEGRNWIARHPVLFSALVGAGAGAVAAGTMENELFCSGGDDDCLIGGEGRALAGAGIGAGIGALVGVVVSVARD